MSLLHSVACMTYTVCYLFNSCDDAVLQSRKYPSSHLTFFFSVSDPFHFDMDPYPWIRFVKSVSFF